MEILIMRGLLFVLIISFCQFGFGQNKLLLFEGNFDEALRLAQSQDKDIFFITRSISCPVFEVFKENIGNDKETIEFLNKQFIVFEFDMDNANDVELKRLKKYYHSWRGFPQLYFIDKNEKLISDINYPLNIGIKKNLEIWRNYKNIEASWKSIKIGNKKKVIDFETLNQFLTYRQIKYSSFDLIQIKNSIDKYFKNIDTTLYSDNQHWFIIKNYVTIFSNPEIFDFVARHKSDFQTKNESKEVIEYLQENYKQFINWRKEEGVIKLSKKYPFNTIPEAKEAVDQYIKYKSIFHTYDSNTD